VACPLSMAVLVAFRDTRLMIDVALLVTAVIHPN
jgi:hypothetical protein